MLRHPVHAALPEPHRHGTGDEADIEPMLRLALALPGPASMRYPKANLESVSRPDNRITALEVGKAEVFDWGHDGCFVVFGTLLSNCRCRGQAAQARTSYRSD